MQNLISLNCSFRLGLTLHGVGHGHSHGLGGHGHSHTSDNIKDKSEIATDKPFVRDEEMGANYGATSSAGIPSLRIANDCIHIATSAGSVVW